MKQLNRYGITTIGDVALTGESWDDFVLSRAYQKVAEKATLRAVFLPCDANGNRAFS